jgi:hypothetical protein
MQADFQAQSSKQGREFEDTVVTLLRIQGWNVVERHVVVHQVEIDIVADDPQGRRWWIECKGSWQGKTPGSKRGDTVKKAVGVAAYLACQSNRHPYMLITSHLPTAGTVGAALLDTALQQGWFTDVSDISLGRMSDEVADIPDDDAT